SPTPHSQKVTFPFAAVGNKGPFGDKTKEPATINVTGSSVLGNVLLSQDPSVQVPSALKGLTVVFEMGTRGSLSPLSPNSRSYVSFRFRLSIDKGRYTNHIHLD